MGETIGAMYLGDGQCQFRVWAPQAQSVAVHLTAPDERLVPLAPQAYGYHQGVVAGVVPGSRYLYRLQAARERPDPASRCQPDDVHSASQVVDPAFLWEDQHWRGLPLESYVLYELHVGTFTPEGTLSAILPHLAALKDLGITALELMPLAAFPGARNWGYDGVYPFAVQHTYGGLAAFKQLVNACHQQGLAVVLDVVYNHLGPEGNYLGDFGPYFTERYATPWGAALNFDGPGSDAVRDFFIANALFWINECHVDALRLDAVHAIMDASALPFVEQLASEVHAASAPRGWPAYLIAESNHNAPRLLLPPALGGYGLDAQWNDDFHHALHTLLTGERDGYYQDFGSMADLTAAWRQGYVYTGQYSRFRQRRHGRDASQLPAHTMVVCAQNHDQVGNRRHGDRLSQLVSFEQLKLAASAVLLSPYIPLLFMGEEYGETAPFPYFTSHTDPALVAAVRRGRREEFAAFGWDSEPPDPQDEGTFLSARLNHGLRQQGQHGVLYAFYRTLLQLRTGLPALSTLRKDTLDVSSVEQVLCVRRWSQDTAVCLLLHFGTTPRTRALPIPAGAWHKRLDSTDPRWQGPGSTIPSALTSTGQAVLTLPPTMAVLFVRA